MAKKRYNFMVKIKIDDEDKVMTASTLLNKDDFAKEVDRRIKAGDHFGYGGDKVAVSSIEELKEQTDVPAGAPYAIHEAMKG